MLVIHRRTVLISLAAIFGALTVVVLLSLLGGVPPQLHGTLAALYLVVVGIFITSAGFHELHDGKQSYWYLMLPASAAEKVVAVVVATGVIWIPFALLSYFLFSIVMAGFSFLIVGEVIALFSPFTASFAEVIGTYVVAHAVFLFGSVYFRGKNLLKTVASLAGFGFGVALLTGLVGWLLFQSAESEFQGLFMGPMNRALAAESLQRVVDVLTVVHEVLTYVVQYVLPPALWLLTWQRYRETEVAHGV